MLPTSVADLLPGLADEVAALAPIRALPDDWTVSAMVDVGNGMCYLRATAPPSTFVAEVTRVAEVLLQDPDTHGRSTTLFSRNGSFTLARGDLTIELYGGLGFPLSIAHAPASSTDEALDVGRVAALLARAPLDAAQARRSVRRLLTCDGVGDRAKGDDLDALLRQAAGGHLDELLAIVAIGQGRGL